jgi:hypothetical protein
VQVVDKIQKDSSADLDGNIQIGDMLMKVDGTNLEELWQAKELLLGQPDSFVTIDVARQPQGKPLRHFKVTLKRRNLSIDRSSVTPSTYNGAPPQYRTTAPYRVADHPQVAASGACAWVLCVGVRDGCVCVRGVARDRCHPHVDAECPSRAPLTWEARSVCGVAGGALAARALVLHALVAARSAAEHGVASVLVLVLHALLPARGGAAGSSAAHGLVHFSFADLLGALGARHRRHAQPLLGVWSFSQPRGRLQPLGQHRASHPCIGASRDPGSGSCHVRRFVLQLFRW